ncbi:hypothetical protein [Altererythrobacter sp. ZODW24]|uniref:hypothetical protein n=1 Tax=Altererythrobacter sp. ZODW24 TaxID=2185142 RepID=UPI000DF7FE17|nr:hypothetical protein [Altererythrobacter sp. ZODW24]
MSEAAPGLLRELTTKYKDAAIVVGVVVAATASSGNLALNADMPTEASSSAIRVSLAEIKHRLTIIEQNVEALGKWQADKDEQLDGRGAFMSCAVQQIQENRRAASAERACDLQVPR